MIWFSPLVLIPLAAVVVTAIDGGWDVFWTTITNGQTAAAIKLTVFTALGVTLVNVVMGTLIAWVLVRDRFWGKSVLEVLIDIPFALPTIVAGLVLLSLYGTDSPLGIDVANSRPAVFLAFLFVTLPFVVRMVQPVLEELDRDVEEAAASLGASRLTTFRRVILPSLAPAIAAGAALSFARGVSEYGSLVLLSGNLPFKTEVTSVRILSSIENDNVAGAAAVATVLLAISLAVIVALDLIQRRVAAVADTLVHDIVEPPPAVERRREPRVRKSPTTYVLRFIATAYLFFLVAWPVSLVATNTFDDGFGSIRLLLEDPDIRVALQLSAYVAFFSVVINTVFGVGMSLLLVRYEFPGKRALSALLDLPLSVSPIVVGLALVLVYGGRNGWLGRRSPSRGFDIIFSTPGIVMATTFVALPLMIRELVPVLEEIGIEQEQAAQSLGASGFQRFLRITLPSIKWGIVYGVVLTLARSLGEFGAVKVVSGNVLGQTRTATLVVEEKYLNFDQQGAYATAFLLAMVSVACIVIVGIIRPKNHA